MGQGVSPITQANDRRL